MHLPVSKQLNSVTAVEINWMVPPELRAGKALFNAVIIEGETYPHDKPLSEEEFIAY
jgi:hypothetical protein